MTVNGYEHNNAIIQAETLTKKFGQQAVVDHVDFEIPEGSIFGFIGPSGCGKTTTVRLLTGIYQPSSGDAFVMGKSPKNFKRRDHERIGYMPQHFALYPQLTVWENLNFTASMYGVSFLRKERLDEILEFVELEDHKHKLVQNISGGMQRRLSLAATLVHEPDLLFLDEPTGGIDPVLRKRLWDYFKELREKGKTLFVTTQYVSEAAYCDLVGMMVEGKVLSVDTPKGLRKQAMGGDIIVVKTVTEMSRDQIETLEAQDFVSGEVERSGENQVNITVEDASRSIPLVVTWCSQHDLELETIQEYLPPFDEVFIKLIRGYMPDA